MDKALHWPAKCSPGGASLKRTLYKPLGLVCLALGTAGIVLPILPTTPFVLLAAWFFAQSSERWHRMLLDSELFGPVIDNWERSRCISRRTKVVALCSMVLAGSASIIFAMSTPTPRIITAALMAIGAATVLRLRTCEDCRQEAAEQGAGE